MKWLKRQTSAQIEARLRARIVRVDPPESAKAGSEWNSLRTVTVEPSQEAQDRLQAREQRHQQSLASPPLHAAGIPAHSRTRQAASQVQTVGQAEPPPEQDPVQAALERAEALSGELQRVLGSDGDAGWLRWWGG